MCSTAIVSKMLAERMELATPHGRDVMGVLLFQDLAVVAVPDRASRRSTGAAGARVRARLRGRQGRGRAAAHPAALGPAPDARAGSTSSRGSASTELFMLNVLLVTLGLAWLTELAGPVAGAGRVPRRHADRRDRVPLPGRGGHQAVPRRPAGAVLHHHRHVARPRASCAANWRLVALLLVVPVLVKFALIVLLSRAVRRRRSATALRTGFYLAQAGEFALVMLALSAAADADRPRARAGGAGGDGAVDAGGAVADPVRRAARARG